MNKKLCKLFQQLDFLLWYELWLADSPYTYKMLTIRFSNSPLITKSDRKNIIKYLTHNSTLAAISLHLQKHIEQQNI